MLVAIHQPHYLPWLRYFEKIHNADRFVVLDTVQYSKNGWQNRNKVKTPAGAALLTVPVHAQLSDTLSTVRIANHSAWPRKHYKCIAENYRNAPFWPDHEPFFADLYKREWTSLVDLNRVMLEYFLEQLGVDTPVSYASALDVDGEATERLANLVKAVGGDRYYSGAYALDTYLDRHVLEAAGVGLELQTWSAPRYPQLHGAFIPDLSIVDLILNCGPDSLSYVERGARDTP